MKKSITKKALFMSFCSLFLCFTMLIGTTYAWFTDSVTSDVNQIVAGNLDVELEYYTANGWDAVDGKNNIFNPNAKWEPGHAEIVYLKVSNVGDLALKYLLSIDIVEEKIGLTKDGEQIKLSDHLLFGIVDENVAEGIFDNDRAAAIAAVENPKPFAEALADQHNYASHFGNLKAKEGNVVDNDTVAIVIWMPSDVGNEANHNGVNVPSVKFCLNLMATQDTVENDSFDHLYDEDAEFDYTGMGVATIMNGDEAVAHEIRVRNSKTGAKVGSFVVDADSVASGASELKGHIDPGTLDSNIVIDTGMEYIAYDVSVEGLKDNNDIPVIVRLRIPAGLDSNTVTLYHKDQVVNGAVYDPNSGYVMFETASFSPFAIVFDKDSKDTPTTGNPADLPVAVVTTFPLEDTPGISTEIEWGSFGGFGPDYGVDADPKLETSFTFKSDDTYDEALAGDYADWYCDFYVSLDRDLGANQIFLGGSYGTFGWVGFHNGDVTLGANEELPLLGSVTQNPWTYADVVSFVREFTCGVGDVNDALSGATFTVKLRLTNPANEREFYDVATIPYTFN